MRSAGAFVSREQRRTFRFLKHCINGTRTQSGRMVKTLLFATLILCGSTLILGTQEAIAAEPLSTEFCRTNNDRSTSEPYYRLHQIPTKGDHTLPMVTPGGMILEHPKMVAATDVLTIVKRDASALCFRLVTFWKNRHQCQLAGVARLKSAPTFVFSEGGAVVRFTILNDDEIKVEPHGDGYRSRCESLGVIQPATYSRRGSR